MSVRAVLAGGAVRELSGVDVGLVADAEATTGIISQVTVRVRPLEAEPSPPSAAPTPATCRAASTRIIAADLPIWSMVYSDPRMAEQMPTMMPGIMDDLMPHVIDDVVPLVTGPMFDYLQGRGAGRRARRGELESAAPAPRGESRVDLLSAAGTGAKERVH